jgi:hypothetical protein
MMFIASMMGGGNGLSTRRRERERALLAVKKNEEKAIAECKASIDGLLAAKSN